jgi:hypothetical protein
MNIIKLASINPDFLRKVLLLGAVGGAGTGLVQSLLKHRQAIVEDNEDEDDDVVAADVHQHKIASEALTSGMNIAAGTAEKANQLINFLKSQVAGQKQAPAKPAEPAAPDNRLGMLDYALGGTGLPLAFLASMTGVRGLYNRYERKELQNKMRDEQEALMAEIEREARSKSASDGRAPGRIDLGLMAVLGALGLTGITTGVLTDQMLTSQFPRVRQRSNSTRILTPRNSAATGQEEEEEEAKSASELLVHTVLSLENGDGDVTDAVKAKAWHVGLDGAQPGDLLIMRRDGQDPTLGGIGHVGRIESIDAASVCSIDGNHDNAVSRVSRSLSDPNIIGHIRYSRVDG